MKKTLSYSVRTGKITWNNRRCACVRADITHQKEWINAVLIGQEEFFSIFKLWEGKRNSNIPIFLRIVPQTLSTEGACSLTL